MATAAAASTATPRGSAAPVVTPVVADPAAPMPSSAHRHNGAVSHAVAAAAGVVAPNGAARESGTNSVSVSAYVGHDHDHSGVFSNVFGDSVPSSAAPASVVDDKQPDAAPRTCPQPEATVVSTPDVGLDPVSRLVAEKKRKFHSGRLLELKNLPDGCTEQVGNRSGIEVTMQTKAINWSKEI